MYGKLQNDEGEINFPIKRASTGHKMAAMPIQVIDLLSRKTPTTRDRGNISGSFKAREALTTYKTLQKFVNFTLLKVKIKTGRTHQIRVHFYAYGNPLVGDTLYNTKKTKLKNEKLKLGRIFLMACHLSFKDLNGEKKDFILELGDDLKKFLPRH